MFTSFWKDFELVEVDAGERESDLELGMFLQEFEQGVVHRQVALVRDFVEDLFVVDVAVALVVEVVVVLPYVKNPILLGSVRLMHLKVETD